MTSGWAASHPGAQVSAGIGSMGRVSAAATGAVAGSAGSGNGQAASNNATSSRLRTDGV